MKTFYLVTLNTTLDDLPLEAYETMTGARALIASINSHPDPRDHDSVSSALGVAGRDISDEGVLGFNIWAFVGGKLFTTSFVERPADDAIVPLGCDKTVRLYECPQEEWDSPDGGAGS